MKKFLILQIILIVLIHFTADAKRLAEPAPNCPLTELQIQENIDEDTAIKIEQPDIDFYIILSEYTLTIINCSNYKLQILKPPQNTSNFLLNV